jgi:hypothetical protein
VQVNAIGLQTDRTCQTVQVNAIGLQITNLRYAFGLTSTNTAG